MRTLLTFLLAAICVVGYSQKKPKINQALSAMEDGNLAEAKSIIDAAIEHEKTKDDPKTWFYRGQIYATLDTATHELGALEESLKSFDKALELDPEQSKVLTLTSTGIENIDTNKQDYYAYYYNNAIADYNAESFKSAAKNFETAFYIMPSDTSAILNAAYAAAAGGDNVQAEGNFMKSYEAGVRNKAVFLQLYNFAIREERFEDGLDIIRKGKEAHPDDINFAKYEIDLLIQLKKTEEAKAELEKAIESDPQNSDLLFSLGVLQDETGDSQGAIESYRKAVEANPNHYNANFNLGVTEFNKANELIKEKNALGYKETTKNKELTKKINAKLENALPIWEKLYSWKNTDQTVLETLGYIYNNLGKKAEYTKIQNELDALDN